MKRWTLLLIGCFLLTESSPAQSGHKAFRVEQIPAYCGMDPFYGKMVDAAGILILASPAVADSALLIAALTVDRMLEAAPVLRDSLIGRRCGVIAIGRQEQISDIPHYAFLCDTPDKADFLNRRARGFGGNFPHDRFASCGEENLLRLPEDRYHGENILVHEFAHLIHSFGLSRAVPSFGQELRSAFQAAQENPLWLRTYALENEQEYFAEAVQSFFNVNRHADPADGIHGPISDRERLRTCDPGMYQLLTRYFPDTDLSATVRKTHHTP